MAEQDEGIPRSAGRATAVTTVAGAMVVAVAVGSMLLRGRPPEVLYARWILHGAPAAVVALGVSHLVLRRRPGHGAGRLLLVMGLLGSVHSALAATADARLAAAGWPDAHASFTPAALPLDAALPIWVMSWIWVAAAVLLVVGLPLAFPDGQRPAGLGRFAVGAAATGGGLLMAAQGVVTWPTSTAVLTVADMPLDGSRPVAVSAAVGAGLVVAGVAMAVTVLMGRARRARGPDRGPFRAVGAAALLVAVIGTATWPWQAVWRPAILVGITGLVVVYGLAVARYRRDDLDPLLGRAAVGAVLAVVVTLVWLGVVVGVGSLVGRRGDSALLPLVAVALVAVLVEPVRRLARRLVDRFLYGRDTDHAEVLAALAERAGSATSSEDVLEHLVDLLVRSTGADRAEVHLAGTGLAAASGREPRAEPLIKAPVLHAGELLADVRLHARHRADLVRDAERIVADVTSSLGVYLRNVRLTEELQRSVDELRLSRQRLVEAHEEARRGLERDIHDGAQSRLIGLRMRVGAARIRAESRDDDVLQAQLDEIGVELDATVRCLRELARGLLPPVLEQAGLSTALRAHARTLPLPVTIEATGVGRYARPVESAVYFSCLETMQNAARHARPTRITIDLDADDELLRFTVSDDGVGFEPEIATWSGLGNVDDRLSALGGRLDIASSPGAGTRVTGEVPATSLGSQPSDSAR